MLLNHLIIRACNAIPPIYLTHSRNYDDVKPSIYHIVECMLLLHHRRLVMMLHRSLVLHCMTCDAVTPFTYQIIGHVMLLLLLLTTL